MAVFFAVRAALSATLAAASAQPGAPTRVAMEGMAPAPDAALMLAFQRGDESAFRALYQGHARAMVAFCHHFVRDAARAEELAQDVFVKLYRSAHRYRPRARFKTFLYRVATNHCLNEIRRGEYSARERVDREGPHDPDRVGREEPCAPASRQVLEEEREDRAGVGPEEGC